MESNYFDQKNKYTVIWANKASSKVFYENALRAELTNLEQCKNAVEKVVDEFGRIDDGLVNNADVNDGVGLEMGGTVHAVVFLAVARRSRRLIILTQLNEHSQMGITMIPIIHFFSIPHILCDLCTSIVET